MLCAICGSGLYCHLHDQNPTVSGLEAARRAARCQTCLGQHLVTQQLDGREVFVPCPACQPTLLEG